MSGSLVCRVALASQAQFVLEKTLEITILISFFSLSSLLCFFTLARKVNSHAYQWCFHYWSHPLRFSYPTPWLLPTTPKVCNNRLIPSPTPSITLCNSSCLPWILRWLTSGLNFATPHQFRMALLQSHHLLLSAICRLIVSTTPHH